MKFVRFDTRNDKGWWLQIGRLVVEAKYNTNFSDDSVSFTVGWIVRNK